MSNTETFLRQIDEWLSDNDGRWNVEAQLDLPDVGWVTVRKVTMKDGLLTMEYAATLLRQLEDHVETMLCSPSEIRAVRRTENIVARMRRNRETESS